MIQTVPQLNMFYKAFKEGSNHPFDQSECQTTAVHFIISCPSPSSPSYKNTAFFTTWHWEGRKEDWRSLSVISYHPPFLLPLPLPSSPLWDAVGASEVGRKRGTRLLRPCCCGRLALLLPTPTGVRLPQRRRSVQLQIESAWAFMRRRTKQETSWNCQSSSHAPQDEFSGDKLKDIF